MLVVRLACSFPSHITAISIVPKLGQCLIEMELLARFCLQVLFPNRSIHLYGLSTTQENDASLKRECLTKSGKILFTLLMAEERGGEELEHELVL